MLLPWETLRASFSTSLLCAQPQALDADLPSMAAAHNHKSWIAILEQHASWGVGSHTSTDTDGQGMNNSTEDSIDEEQLSDAIKHSVMPLCGYTQSVTPTLAEPLLPVPLARAGLASQLMHASSKPQIPDYLPLVCAQRSVLGSCKATYCSLVVQDMELQDTVTTLPFVLFDDNSAYGTDEAESQEDTWQRCVSDCHIKQLKTGHLKLYLDWSLSDRSASSSRTLQEYKRHLDQSLRPTKVSAMAADSALDEPLSAACITHMIEGVRGTPPGVPYNAIRQPEQLPHAVKARLQAQAQRSKRAQHAQLGKVWAQNLSRQSSPAAPLKAASTTVIPASSARADPANGAAAMLPSDTGSEIVQPANTARASANSTAAAQQTQATGVFQKRRPTTKAQGSARQQVEPAGNDMAYFLGLQQGAAHHPPQPRAPALASSAALAPAPGAGAEASQCQVVDLCADDASLDEEEDTVVMELPDVQYSVLCLPERHQGLLQRMQEEHAAIFRQHASIGAEVRWP